MFHPKRGPSSTPVKISHPTQATNPATWNNRQTMATFLPEGPVPASINDIPIAPLGERRHAVDWAHLAQAKSFNEPDYSPAPGYKAAAGAVVLEPDQRVWVVHPTNAFGGYQITFPKGTVAKGTTLRETALREVFEEAGLLVELLTFLTDSQRSTSLTRYYLARRMTGSPADMEWESQAVSLVPLTELESRVNQSADKAIARHLLDLSAEWGQWF